MGYMLEMAWIAPAAGRVVEILSVLPPHVVQTASLPRTDRGARSEFALRQVEAPKAAAMRRYETDDVTFDTRRTILALGGLDGRGGPYPFLVRHVRHRVGRRARRRRLRAIIPALAWGWLGGLLPV
jgi:hypothetical protein